MEITHEAAESRTEPEPKGEPLKDAYWSYRPIEYVPHGPALRSSLFDRDADQLRNLYSSAVVSMSADEPDQEIQDRVRLAEERLQELSMDISPPNADGAEGDDTSG